MPEENKKENTVNDQTTKNVAEEKTEKKQVGIQNNKPVLVLGVLLVALAVMVFGALAVSHNRFSYRINNNDHMFYGRDNANIGRQGMMGNYGILQNRVSGKVSSVNGKAFTLDANGTTYNVQISDTARFPINSSNTVKTGDTVLVWGQKDSNGVVQATQISVNPNVSY